MTLALVALACLIAASTVGVQFLRYGGAILLIYSLIRLCRAWLVRWKTQVVATNRRVLVAYGFVSRHTVEMNASRIETVDVDQNVLGRILNFGTVTIKGTGTTIEPIQLVDRPLELRTAITAN